MRVDLPAPLAPTRPVMPGPDVEAEVVEREHGAVVLRQTARPDDLLHAVTLRAAVTEPSSLRRAAARGLPDDEAMWRLVMLACVLTTGCAVTAESRSAGSPSTSAAGVPSASASPSGSTVADAPTPKPKPKPGHVVIAADSAYGPMLYDATGQPIYLFTAERRRPPGLLRRVRGRLAAGAHPG